MYACSNFRTRYTGLIRQFWVPNYKIECTFKSHYFTGLISYNFVTSTTKMIAHLDLNLTTLEVTLDNFGTPTTNLTDYKLL